MNFRKILDSIIYWLTTGIYAVLVVLLIPVLVKSIFFDALGMICAYKLKWWMAGNFVGIIAGFLLYGLFSLTLFIPRVKHNLNWFMNFTHELTHTLVSVCFFAKIREFVVKDRECYVSYKAGPIGYVPITLAPYCIPIYTFMLFPFRFFGDSHYMVVFDILIAFTYAFHIHSFIKQTSPTQSDIEGCGFARSAMFITFVHMCVLSVILATPKGGVANAVIRVFWKYPVEFLTKPQEWIASVMTYL